MRHVAAILDDMSEDLTPGLHEALITEELLLRIEQARALGWIVESRAIYDATIARYWLATFTTRCATESPRFPPPQRNGNESRST